MPFTPASITKLIDDLDTTPAGLARRLRVTDGTISRWLSGDRTPTGLYAIELERLAAQAALGRSGKGAVRPQEIRAIVSRILEQIAPGDRPADSDYQRGYKDGYQAASQAVVEALITSILTGQSLATPPKEQP